MPGVGGTHPWRSQGVNGHGRERVEDPRWVVLTLPKAGVVPNRERNAGRQRDTGQGADTLAVEEAVGRERNGGRKSNPGREPP